MKRLLPILFLLFCICTSYSQEANQVNSEASTYYFIRHAEKNRIDKENKNPHLNEIGKQRAEKWNLVFENVEFDAVYSTDYFRTKETALPSARKNSLDLKIYNPREIDAIAFINETKGQSVLIVGHSNTTPTFVNSILGVNKYQQIEDTNNGNLYILTISKSGDISDALLVIN